MSTIDRVSSYTKSTSLFIREASAKGLGTPFSNVAGADLLRGPSPGTRVAVAQLAHEVELTADGRLGATGVRDVVRVEGHHVRHEACVAVRVCAQVADTQQVE